MAFTLGPKARAAGYRLAAYDTIGSTSAEALSRAKAGDAGKVWVVASQQSEGHGRRGRPWQTPPGNLAASLLLVLPRANAAAPTLGFAAGLALEGAIRKTTTAGIALKWPNDVLLNGAKVAGILLEATALPNDANAVVIGIGVNVRHAPEGVPYPATALAAEGVNPDAEALFAALSDAWMEQDALWNAGRGFGAMRDRWLERAAGLGGPIAVTLGADVVHGTFETIDDEGRLIVRATDGSARSVAAGDVYFGAAGTAR